MKSDYHTLEAECKRLDQTAKSRVLTIRAETWAAMHGEDLSKFHPTLVEAYDRPYQPTSLPAMTAKAGLAKLCEELGARVITDVHPAIVPHIPGSYEPRHTLYLIGTALIPIPPRRGH
jgi:hypothetical protein